MDFDLKEEYFKHPSVFHGIMHTYRVMHNVRQLTQKHSLPDEIFRIAYCSAFIHDMARAHDGFCDQHGKWTVVETLPYFEEDFMQFGLNNEGMEALKTAVTYHSISEELSLNHQHYLVTALLKDADTLDRIRLGMDNLNPNYLRLSNSYELIEEAEKNYYLTRNLTASCLAEFNGIIDQSKRKPKTKTGFWNIFKT